MIPYLENNYKGRETVETFLQSGVTFNDVLESAYSDMTRIYRNRGSVAKAALDKFFIAFRSLFHFLAENNIYNHNIMVLFSRNVQKNTVLKRIREEIGEKLLRDGIVLIDAMKDPPIASYDDDKPLKFLLEELGNR